MDGLAQLLDGFGTALSPAHLLWALVGVTIGTAVGVLPGIGPALTVALLLPLTYRVDPASALIMFAGIYYGGMYGGSTSSILLNTPGESASIVTALEGNRMARAGRGATALATAAIGSFIAGTIGTLALSVVASPVADFALRFGPPEYFALMVVAFTTVAAVFGRNMLLGLLSLALGLAVGLVGIDVQTGQARLTFGIPQLLDGIDVVVLVVGLFAIGEALYQIYLGRAQGTVEPVRTRAWLSREEWRRSWPAWLRGTAIGFPLGSLPAGGAEVPTFLSYALERRLAWRRGEFGHGAIEGVAGPEAANNASAAGVMVPLLTIGLPTSATAAVILTAFQSYGLQPGPQLFTQSGALVWTLIASLYVGNLMLLVLNLPLAGVWARLLMIPPAYLYGGILVFSTLGVYAVNGSVTDLFVLYAIGVLGFAMRAADVPIAPAVVGLILGPLAEQQLRRALAIGEGDPRILLSSPICVVLLAVAVIVVLVPALRRLLRARGDRTRARAPR
ncbi:MAG TPA: tripartite tricarboxylate transporter permease [Streptosporangiaceae bacterium]|nr:tripartite tricarboxylate transporter permease [Streptosporangiaceae bacterium]